MLQVPKPLHPLYYFFVSCFISFFAYNLSVTSLVTKEGDQNDYYYVALQNEDDFL